MIKFFAKGIEWSNPNLSHNWHIWWQYLAWCIQAKMRNNLYWPMWVQVWWYRRFNRHVLRVPLLNHVWYKIHNAISAKTGGRSHRCEFTDKKQGALYGGTDGAFMDKYFEQLLRNIDKDND